MYAKKSSQDLTSGQLFGEFLGQINELPNARQVSKPPDIERLRAAMRGEVLPAQGEPRDAFVKRSLEAIADALVRIEKVSIKNPFDPTIEKSIPSRGGHDSYTPHARNNSEIFSEKFDYKKNKALYDSRIPEDEAQILARLDHLLCENEITGLDEEEMLEVRELYKKVR